MIVEAFGKINWSLDITGLRPDGYHLLDMLMQPVSLADRMEILPAAELTLSVSGPSGKGVPADEGNLALRAALLLKKTAGTRQGAAISLTKRIPVQAGMGGGSSDAAAVLNALNLLWRTGLTGAELEEMSLALGADVPFLVQGGLARSSGIGEKLVRLPCGRNYPLLVLQPEEGLSTGEVFRAWHREAPAEKPRTDLAAEALRSGSVPAFAPAFRNVLEPVSRRLNPEIQACLDALQAAGAVPALMTGSGSAVFGVFEEEEARDAAWVSLSRSFRKIWRCSTQSESFRILSP